LEFTPQFYDPVQGDLILNPVDERMPYWTPSDEVRYAPEALTVANSLFPDKPRENPFFTEAARSIFAYLLARYKPTPELLTDWMRHFEEIDQRLEGTALAPFVAPTAGGQRAAVQSTFNQTRCVSSPANGADGSRPLERRSLGSRTQRLAVHSEPPRDSRKLATARESVARFIAPTPDDIGGGRSPSSVGHSR
jgi:hypothetical protein